MFYWFYEKSERKGANLPWRSMERLTPLSGISAAQVRALRLIWAKPQAELWAGPCGLAGTYLNLQPIYIGVLTSKVCALRAALRR